MMSGLPSNMPDGLPDDPRQDAPLARSIGPSREMLPDFFEPGVAGMAAEAPAQPQHEVLISLLRRRKWTIVGVAAAVILLAVPLIWMLMKPQYTSSARIQIEPEAPRILYKTEQNGSLPMYETALNTEVSAIRSSLVLQRVLDQQEVQKTVWYRTPVSTLFGDPPSMLERLIEELEVQPIPKTQIIMVSMTTLDPKSAETIVNAVADQYLLMSSQKLNKQDDQRFETLTRLQEDLQRQITRQIETKAGLADKLGTDTPSELRTRLTVYREEMLKELDALRREAAVHEWELKEMSARQQASSQPATADVTAPYSADPEWRRLSLELEAARLNLQNGKENLGAANPRYKELVAAVAHSEHILKLREQQIDHEAPTLAGRTASASVGPRAPTTRVELEAVIAHLKAQEQQLVLSLDKKSEEIAHANEVARQLAAADDELARLRASHHEVSTRREQLAVEEKAPGRTSILARGIAASKPAKDRRIMMSILAIFGAIFLGGAIAYGREILDASINEVHDVVSSVKAPFLGVLPFVPSPLQVNEDDASRWMLRESLRLIRTALMQRVGSQQACAIVITSPGMSVGKSTSAVLLARSLDELGKRVLLVDADLRRRTLSGWFANGSTSSLRSLLLGTSSADDPLHQLPGSACDFLPAGRESCVRDPELLANGAMTALLASWKSKYDFVLLDSPPLLSVADASVLAGAADGSILVMRAGSSRRPDAVESFAGLAATGSRLLGTILVNSKHSPAYYRSYNYNDYLRPPASPDLIVDRTN